jgi:hypothetical protein
LKNNKFIKKKNKIVQYKSLVFWKLYRYISTFTIFKKFVFLKKSKRKKILESKNSFLIKQKKVALQSIFFSTFNDDDNAKNNSNINRHNKKIILVYFFNKWSVFIFSKKKIQNLNKFVTFGKKKFANNLIFNDTNDNNYSSNNIGNVAKDVFNFPILLDIENKKQKNCIDKKFKKHFDFFEQTREVININKKNEFLNLNVSTFEKRIDEAEKKFINKNDEEVQTHKSKIKMKSARLPTENLYYFEKNLEGKLEFKVNNNDKKNKKNINDSNICGKTVIIEELLNFVNEF